MTEYLRVVTFNIRHGKGMNGKVSLTGVAETLMKINAHIIGLQEVDNFLPRSFFQHQACKLARHLHTEYAFAPNLKLLFRTGFGNATLSRFPILKTGNIRLPGKLERRGLQHCLLSLPGGGIVHFFNTHLGLSTEDRTVQVRTIVDNLPGKHHPVILTGDFNTPAGSPELQPLAERLSPAGAGKNLLTYPAAEPLHSIDHIYISDHWQVREIEAVASRASDHLPLVCTLEPASSPERR